MTHFFANSQTTTALGEHGDTRLLVGGVFNTSVNSSCQNCRDRTFLPGTGVKIFLASTMVLLACSAMAANLLVIVTIIFTRRLRTVTSVYLVNLALCDFLVGIIIMPLTSRNVVEANVVYSKIACDVIGFISSVLGISSILTLAAIALDRYQAIVNCFQYSSRCNVRYVCKVLSWIWLQSLTCSAPPLFGWGRVVYLDGTYVCAVDWSYHLTYAIFMLVTCFLLPLMIMVYCYINIIKIARQHVRRIADISIQVSRVETETVNNTATGAIGYALVDPIQRLSLFPTGTVSGSTNENSANANNNDTAAHAGEDDNLSNISTASNMGLGLKREVRATARLIGLVLAFLISWLPYVFLSMKHAVHGFNTENYPSTKVPLLIVIWMTMVSSSVNPFLYAIISRRFRLAMRRLFCRRKRRRQPKRHKSEKSMDISQNLGVNNVVNPHGACSDDTKTPVAQNGVKSDSHLQRHIQSKSRKKKNNNCKIYEIEKPTEQASISITSSSGQYLHVPHFQKLSRRQLFPPKIPEDKALPPLNTNPSNRLDPLPQRVTSQLRIHEDYSFLRRRSSATDTDSFTDGGTGGTTRTDLSS